MDERKWQEKTIVSQDNGLSDPFTFPRLSFCPCVNREEACPDTRDEKGGKIDISCATTCGVKL